MTWKRCWLPDAFRMHPLGRLARGEFRHSAFNAIHFRRAFRSRTFYLPARFMATVRPFAALRPKPELAAQICELPYDVLSSNEAREIAAGNPLSFLRVSKPEIDLPPGTDIYSPQVYAKGEENFRRLITEGALRQDAQPCFYLYRQIMGGHGQIGLVAAASCEEDLRGLVKKHELTRPGKSSDPGRRSESLRSPTGPALLAYRARPRDAVVIAGRAAQAPA